MTTEFFHLVVAVTLTSFLLNYWNAAAGWVRAWVVFEPELVNVAVFWLLFFIGLGGTRWVAGRLTSFLGWERLNWTMQLIGVVLGALRGAWWLAFLLLALTSSGAPYLQASVQERSLIGSRVAEPARMTMERIAEAFPGAALRPNPALPSLVRSVAKKTAPSETY